MLENKRCCKNCFYFIDKSGLRYSSSPKWEFEFACHLHGSEARISHPDSQFCGDEHWVSFKVKTRIDKLEKLGI
jgi:hypothetical protein